MTTQVHGTREILRYTLGQLVELNHGKSIGPGSATYELFSSYPEPHTTDYLNQHNKRFHRARSAPVGPTPVTTTSGSTSTATATTITTTGAPVPTDFTLKKAHVYSDQKILEDIRKVISNISKGSGKVQLAISRMNQLSIPSTQAESVAKLFHLSMIECDFLIDEYIGVLIGFTNLDKSLMERLYTSFIRMVIGEFKTPSKFEDTHAESAYDKQTRWRIRNALILAKLYNLKVPETPEFSCMRGSLETSIIIEKFIDPIFNSLSPTDNSTTQLLVAVWSVIAKSGTRLSKESPSDYARYIAKIDELTKSVDYKMTDKVRLMGLLS